MNRLKGVFYQAYAILEVSESAGFEIVIRFLNSFTDLIAVRMLQTLVFHRRNPLNIEILHRLVLFQAMDRPLS